MSEHPHDAQAGEAAATGGVPPHGAGPDAHDTPGREPASIDGTYYTCPMHTEIREDRPGTCSK